MLWPSFPVARTTLNLLKLTVNRFLRSPSVSQGHLPPKRKLLANRCWLTDIGWATLEQILRFAEQTFKQDCDIYPEKSFNESQLLQDFKISRDSWRRYYAISIAKKKHDKSVIFQKRNILRILTNIKAYIFQSLKASYKIDLDLSDDDFEQELSNKFKDYRILVEFIELIEDENLNYIYNPEDDECQDIECRWSKRRSERIKPQPVGNPQAIFVPESDVILKPERQVLAELLIHLDCQAQKKIIEEQQARCLTTNQWANAFFLEAHQDLYPWINYALVRSIEAMLGAAVISSTGKEIRKGQSFWDSVAGELCLNQGDPLAVIPALCDRIQHQPVVMIIKEINAARDQFSTFWESFWIPLYQQLMHRCQDSSSIYRHRSRVRGGLTLLLLSTEASAKLQRFCQKNYFSTRPEDLQGDQKWQFPTILDPVQSIHMDDVFYWLNRQNVMSFIDNHLEENRRFLIEEKLRYQESHNIFDVIDQICCALNFQAGFWDLEPLFHELLRNPTGEVVHDGQ